MSDADLRKLERQLAVEPSNASLRRKWLMARARIEPSMVKTYYKIRCGDKWFSSGGYRQSFQSSKGTRFKTEAEAMKKLLQFTQNQRRGGGPRFQEPAVDIICFEVHTLKASTKTVDLVDAAKQIELAEIRSQKAKLEKQAAKLLAKEEALMKEANAGIRDKLKEYKKKPAT